MATLYVAKSRSLQTWGHSVGITKHLYKVGVSEGSAEDRIAEMNAGAFAGRDDWRLMKKAAAEASEDEVIERLNRREQMIDPGYYPQLRDARGIFKVKLTNVENDIVVRAALSSEYQPLAAGKPKEKDVADYLLRHAAGGDTPA